MSLEVDYLAVASQGSAPNVESQGAFAGSGHQLNGFITGFGLSNQINKVLRQSSIMTAAWANVISQVLQVNVIDDGNLPALITLLLQTLNLLIGQLVQVAFSAMPVFNAQLGNKFEITLTGNVTGSTFTNGVDGFIYIWIIHQDAVGGRTFVWPANIPGSTPVDSGVNATSVQAFIADGSGVLHPLTSMTVS